MPNRHHSLRTQLTAGLLLCMACHRVPASEGLAALGAFTCEPVRVTRSVIEACLAGEPALRGKYGTLLEDWMTRNARDAETLENDCRAQASKAAATAQQSEELWSVVRRTNDQTIRSKLADAARSPGGCDALLSEIQQGRGELAPLVLKR